jgi:dihydroneopterin aldolase/2-amino-4-hydroxy-6-hydroxymethyldihydropteridine diphosphokinase
MARAFVSVGSNIEPEKNVRSALQRLGEQVTLRAVSTVYLTEPIGPAGQPPYYNCVVDVETDLTPLGLKQKVLRGIETALGRTRTADKYAPRTIDLDLILYGEVVMTTDELVLPDPDIFRRPFLAAAVRELAPNLVMPGSGKSINDAAASMPHEMKPLEQYTKLIRKEILHGRTE